MTQYVRLALATFTSLTALVLYGQINPPTNLTGIVDAAVNVITVMVGSTSFPNISTLQFGPNPNPGSSGGIILTGTLVAPNTLLVSPDFNTATIASKAVIQSGSCDVIRSVNGTAAYTYDFGSNGCIALTAYTAYQHFKLIPDVTNSSGNCSLNLNNVGLKNIKDKTGESDLPANFFVPGQMYDIWFDGTVFRSQS